MNYTGLGVGNRNGVYTQLAGCCLSVIGMVFAFYIKPILKRRRREQAHSTTMREQEEKTGATTGAHTPEPIAVG